MSDNRAGQSREHVPLISNLRAACLARQQRRCGATAPRDQRDDRRRRGHLPPPRAARPRVATASRGQRVGRQGQPSHCQSGTRAHRDRRVLPAGHDCRRAKIRVSGGCLSLFTKRVQIGLFAVSHKSKMASRLRSMAAVTQPWCADSPAASSASTALVVQCRTAWARSARAVSCPSVLLLPTTPPRIAWRSGPSLIIGTGGGGVPYFLAARAVDPQPSSCSHGRASAPSRAFPIPRPRAAAPSLARRQDSARLGAPRGPAD